MAKRQISGKIVSDKMDKTVVVEIQRIVQHPKYLRRIKRHKKYKAHDEKNEYKTGDEVLIEETKPFAKDKHWRVLKKI